jgi:hypothetical protein
MSYYQLHREERLAYQKQYHQQNKSYYNSYQVEYYHARRNDPEFLRMRKLYQDRFYAKKCNQKLEQRLQKRHEKEIKKQEKQCKKQLQSVFKELLKKTEYKLAIQDCLLVQSKKEPVIVPFSGIRVNTQGYFVLDF